EARLRGVEPLRRTFEAARRQIPAGRDTDDLDEEAREGRAGQGDGTSELVHRPASREVTVDQSASPVNPPIPEEVEGPPVAFLHLRRGCGQQRTDRYGAGALELSTQKREQQPERASVRGPCT